jgi:hypothetical protein
MPQGQKPDAPAATRVDRRMKHNGMVLLVGLVVATAAAHAETVDVKYRGTVDLKPFDCADITRGGLSHISLRRVMAATSCVSSVLLFQLSTFAVQAQINATTHPISVHPRSKLVTLMATLLR